MFKNYFKTALRIFRKNKATTLINVLGLSIGISSALIIFMVVEYDFSFDKYEPAKERIYRIVTEGDDWKNSGVPAPVHETVKSSVTGFETVAPIFLYNGDGPKIGIPQGNNKPLKVFKKQENFAFADNNYFKIFPHEWLAGNPKVSLQNPYNIVLTKSLAQLYFPNVSANDVMGKTVVFDDTLHATITGIIKDLKVNSDFKFKALVSLSTISSGNLKPVYNWGEWDNINSISQVIVKLLPGVQPEQINKQLTAYFKEHKADPEDSKVIHRLQPLSDVHTNTDFIPEGLHFNYFLSQPSVWLFLLLLLIIVSVIAGLYPAFILTRFKPVLVLKNSTINNSGSSRSAWLRKSLIVFQFVIAQVFIIGMMVVDKQIGYSLQKDMGFRKDAIINFTVPFDFIKPNNKKFILKEEIKKITGVQNVSLG